MLFLVTGRPLQAQGFKYSLPGLDTLETFIVSGSSSAVLKSGQAEVIVSNTLTSYQLALHQSSKDSPILDRLRLTQFISDISAFYGVSRSGRLDVGVQAKYIRSRLDNAAASSMFRVFKSEPDIINPNQFLDQSFGGLAFIGLRVRAIPFESIPELVVTGGYSFSTINDETEQLQLSADRDQLEVILSYYKALNANTYYFFGANGRAFLSSPITDNNRYELGGSFFLIQRTTNQRFTFYPGLSYSLAFKPAVLDSNPNLIKENEFLFAFGGVQYAPNQKYNIFLVGGLPLVSVTTSPRQQIIRSSYSLVSLGLRVGI